MRDLGLQNVVISLGEPHDPRLPADSLDVAILVHMYHEIAQPYGLLYNLIPALKPGARVGIVDAYGPTSEHGTPPGLLRCELAAVGYREISLDRLTGSNVISPSSPRRRLRAGRGRMLWSRARRRNRLPTHRSTARDGRIFPPASRDALHRKGAMGENNRALIRVSKCN